VLITASARIVTNGSDQPWRWTTGRISQTVVTSSAAPVSTA
jgi:hypothetical protein